jgi:hypothetical protein
MWGYELTGAFFFPPVLHFQLTLSIGSLAVTVLVSRELR